MESKKSVEIPKKEYKRVAPEELMEAMFIPRAGKANGRLDSKTKDCVTCYTLSGLSKKQDSEGNCLAEDESININSGKNIKVFAKEIRKDDKSKFYLISDYQNFYDPTNGEHKEPKEKGIDRWHWQLVSPKSFAYYLAFLRTKVSRHIINAEREFFGS